jgi:hypothetical protein
MKTFAIILCLSVLLGHAIADYDQNELSLVSTSLLFTLALVRAPAFCCAKSPVAKSKHTKTSSFALLLQVKGYTLSGDYKFDKHYKCLAFDLVEVQDIISKGYCHHYGGGGRRLLHESESTATGRALLATPNMTTIINTAYAEVATVLNSTLDTLNDTDAGRRHLLDYKPIEVSFL